MNIKQTFMCKRGIKTVLAVDDDPSILDLINRTLSSSDYRLLLASSGEEALELTKKNDSNIDLLLTDVVMSGINGMELANILKAMLAKIKIIFMSGFTIDVIAHYGVLEPGEIFIQKPISPTKLIDKLRIMLNEY